MRKSALPLGAGAPMSTLTRTTGSILGRKAHLPDSGERLDRDALSAYPAGLVKVLCHAAHRVSAHFRLRSVGIEDSHARIRAIRMQNEREAVRADPEMPVAHLPPRASPVHPARQISNPARQNRFQVRASSKNPRFHSSMRRLRKRSPGGPRLRMLSYVGYCAFIPNRPAVMPARPGTPVSILVSV